MLQFVRRRAALDVASFGALRSAAFAAFWPAITIALTGTWMRALVQGYFVYEQTHDARCHEIIDSSGGTSPPSNISLQADRER